MSSAVRQLLLELDGAWQWSRDHKVELRIIGSCALMLLTAYQRVTKDADVFEVLALDDDVKGKLRLLAGSGTQHHRCVNNFHRVERDYFAVDETPVDLTSAWG